MTYISKHNQEYMINHERMLTRPRTSIAHTIGHIGNISKRPSIAGHALTSVK